jgi:phosphohistidine phosphatase
MRRLVLVRHAKAVEDDIAGDHARALSPRGIADAEGLGAWLVAQPWRIDLALCSTATRTRQTLERLGAAIPTILSDRLYLATPGEMLAQIQATDAAVETLLMVGHNPGTHVLLGLLAGHYPNPEDADRVLLKFPTAGCAVLEFAAETWQAIRPEEGTLLVFK